MSIWNLLHAVIITRKAESLTPQQTQHLRQKRFRKLLRHVFSKSRFYKRYYKEHGITERDIDNVVAEDLPVIDKQIMMENYDELVCDPAVRKAELERFISEFTDARVNYKDVYKVIHTSGSSGTPGLFVYGPYDWAKARALGYRAMREKVNPFKRKKIAYIGTMGGHYASITTISDIPHILFKVLTVSINNSIEHICHKVDRFKPDVLIGYASGLEMLAHQQDAGRLNITPGKIFSSADPLTPAIRTNIEKTFGVTPVNIYTASEIMTFSVECELQHRLHYFDDWFDVQLLDDNLRPVKAGMPGRLVVTNLYNYTQPLIRYRMDDEIVLNSEPCPCGWPFGVIEKIAGRSEQTLWFTKADGTREFIHPMVLIGFFVRGLEKFQFIQNKNNRLTVKAVIRGEKDDIVPAIRKRMTEILSQKDLNDTVKIEVKLVDDIPNDSKTGKFRLIIPYSNEI